jgi:hypothetical protein
VQTAENPYEVATPDFSGLDFDEAANMTANVGSDSALVWPSVVDGQSVVLLGGLLLAVTYWSISGVVVKLCAGNPFVHTVDEIDPLLDELQRNDLLQGKVIGWPDGERSETLPFSKSRDLNSPSSP